MRTLTFTEAAGLFDTWANNLVNRTDHALEKSSGELFAQLVVNSSGSYSLKELRKMDHPYARRHGRPRLAPGIINQQTGVFQSSWRQETSSSNGAMITTLWNADPKAGYLEQKTPPPTVTRMFARPITEVTMSGLERDFDSTFDDAFDSIWRF